MDLKTAFLGRIASCLGENSPPLARLVLDDNRYTDSALSRLGTCLQSNTTLTSLSLKQCLFVGSLRPLMSGISRAHSALTVLDLSFTSGPSDSVMPENRAHFAAEVAHYLRGNHSVTSLSFSHYGFGNGGATELAELS